MVGAAVTDETTKGKNITEADLDCETQGPQGSGESRFVRNSQKWPERKNSLDQLHLVVHGKQQVQHTHAVI